MGLAGATIAAGALTAGTGLISAGKAAGASKDAASLQQQQAGQIRSDLMPYNVAGQQILPAEAALALSGPTGGGPNYLDMAQSLAPGAMTQAQLEQTPGYQWTLGQGLKATQSNAAARGLGVSGAALKGAASYATGLANQTYKDQFNLQQQRFANAITMNTTQQGNLTNQFARLNQLGTLGENAAAGGASSQASLINAAAGNVVGAGTAQGAGIQGIGSTVNQGLQNYLAYQNYQKNAPITPTAPQMAGNAPSMQPGQLGVGGFVAPTA